jgi:hypothetical protein
MGMSLKETVKYFSPLSTIQRAREFASAGCDPQTIKTLLAAERYCNVNLVMTKAFAQELSRLSRKLGTTDTRRNQVWSAKCRATEKQS